MELTKENLENILENLYNINNTLRDKYSGLYLASVGPEYNYVWVRDTYYQAKPNLKKDPRSYIQTYRSLLDYYKGLNYKYDNKVDSLIKNPFPLTNIRFVHPRLYPNLEEITGDWGNLQIDAIGYFFLGIAEGLKAGLQIIRDDSDNEIIRKLIDMLVSVKYWTVHDNGIWEENTEIHASSLGAVLGGLLALEEVGYNMPHKIYTNAKKTLGMLLPSESLSKEVDLALLTLIYPFNIIQSDTRETILENCHKFLERERGLIRYPGDKYHENEKGEAEWTFGFTYLFFAYINSDVEKAERYLRNSIELLDENYLMPELFFSGTSNPNENNPLGWSVAMLILAIEKYMSIKNFSEKLLN